MEINCYEVDGVEYKFSGKDIRDVIDEIEHIQYEGLIDTAQNIYNMIMPTSGGKTIKVSHDGKIISKNFRFIDFKNVKNNTFHVSKNVDAQFTTVYLAPDIIPQGKIKSRFSLDLGVKKTVQNGKGEFYLNATDLFNTLVIKKEIQGKDFKYSSSDYYETQVIRLGYNYKF